MVNVRIPVCSSARSEPSTCTCGSSFNPSNARFVTASSRSCITSKPTDCAYFMAACSAIAPAAFTVPASNLCGSSAYFALSRVTESIISPPERNGGIFFNNFFFPYKTPIPIGPKILCPENAKKSASSSCTLTGICGVLCAPSTTITASFSCAMAAISLIGLILPRTLETCVIATIFVFSVICSRT